MPAGGTLVRLVRQIGYAHAMEIMLTARRFTASEMLERGVINQVVSSDESRVLALETAHHIASLSPTAVQTIKEAALTLQDLPLAEAFRQEAVLGQRTFTSEDAKRGLAAFANEGQMIVDGTPHTLAPAGAPQNAARSRPAHCA